MVIAEIYQLGEDGTSDDMGIGQKPDRHSASFRCLNAKLQQTQQEGQSQCDEIAGMKSAVMRWWTTLQG